MSKLNDEFIIGVDFSINKPAACIWSKSLGYKFYGWPYGLQKKLPEIYKNAGVTIIERTEDKDKGPDVSSKMRYEVQNAQTLSAVIVGALKLYLNSTTLIGFEGLSFGSKGDVVLQLGGYKYMIMSALSEFVPLKNMYTYSPITVKKTAGCSKKGMNKNDMIESFILNSEPNSLKTALREDREKFMKKGGKNYIDHLDDIVDSYFVLETVRDKEINNNLNN